MKFSRFLKEIPDHDGAREPFTQELQSASTTEVQQTLRETQLKLEEYQDEIEQISSEYEELFQSAMYTEPYIKNARIAKASRLSKRRESLQQRCQRLAWIQDRCRRELAVRRTDSGTTTNDQSFHQ